MKTSQIVLDLSVAAPSIKRFTNALKEAQRAIASIGQRLVEEEAFLERHEWWKRGEGQPGYVCDRNQSDWWEEGEPPGIAA